MFAGALAGGCERVGPDVVDRYQAVPATLGLLTRGARRRRARTGELLALMRRDKKASGGLTFVLPGPERHRAGRRSPRAGVALRVRSRRLASDSKTGEHGMATILLLSGPNLNLLGRA